jgi:hypothetical protein
MRYFVVTLILGLFFWMLSLPAYSKNEYLGGNWRNCESGHIEPYVEKTERDIDYLDNDDSRDDDELRYGVRFRFKLGFTCNKKFRKQQEERYELEQQIELLKICRKYKSVEMGPQLELVAKKCRDMKFLKKEDKKKRVEDNLFDEILKIEQKKQMELKENGPTKE